MHLLPYDCPSARKYTDTKRHACTAIRLCISPRIQRHQTHGLKQYNFCNTSVHQPAYKQTPNAWPKTMQPLPYDFSSARVYKPCMYYHTIVHQPAYTQTLTHGLKPCNYCHTAVHQPAYTHTSNAWPKAMHLCHTIVHQYTYTESSNAWPKAMHLLPYSCASAKEYTDTKRMA